MGNTVRILKPSKTAMQSGLRNTKRWLLEHDPADRVQADGLMGWAGSHDTDRQLRMWFATKEEAVSFAEKKGFSFRVIEPHIKALRPKAYADNFSFRRIR